MQLAIISDELPPLPPKPRTPLHLRKKRDRNITEYPNTLENENSVVKPNSNAWKQHETEKDDWVTEKNFVKTPAKKTIAS